jgi:hypothetical protein
MEQETGLPGSGWAEQMKMRFQLLQGQKNWLAVIRISSDTHAATMELG